MIQGFKDFITRGNVIDLAVAVVIGSAFTALVTSVVDSIITPLISVFWQPDDSGNVGPSIPDLYGGTVTFPLGNVLNAVISFLAVALVVYFVFVYPMNKFKERAAAKAGTTETAPALPTEQELLVQIRDLLDSGAVTSPAAKSTSPTV